MYTFQKQAVLENNIQAIFVWEVLIGGEKEN